jgi:predicted extracellular nuclease
MVNGDTNSEGDETFLVNVTNVSGATIANGQGVGTITNDDFASISIHIIQGSGTMSPFANQVVTTTGIVTGTKSNGFFIQTPDAEADVDPKTSEGIFIFTSSAPPAAAAIGNSVAVMEPCKSSAPFRSK